MGKAGLTRKRVLEAAVDLVDNHGLDALSMRRLGDELDVEAMSLYRHVSNKSDLLDGVHETVLEEIGVPAISGDWVEDLRALARAFRGVLKAHPKAIPLFATRPAITGASLAYAELALGILGGVGFKASDALIIFQILVAYTVGHTLFQFGVPEEGELPSIDYCDLPVDKFPHFSQTLPDLGTQDPEDEFEYGLDAFLFGLNAKLARSAVGP